MIPSPFFGVGFRVKSMVSVRISNFPWPKTVTWVVSATKAAVRSFARSLATELAPRGIRVNAVSPGLTETPIVGKMGLEPETVEAFGADVAAKTPLGRLGRPHEIANVATFLASSASSFVNGAEFAVDGGYAQV